MNIKSNADNPSFVMDLQLFNDGIEGASANAGASAEGVDAGFSQAEPETPPAASAPEIPPNTDPRKVLPNPLRQDWARQSAREWDSKLDQQQAQQVGSQVLPEQQQQQQGTDQQGQETPENSLPEQIPDKFKQSDGTVNVEALMKSYLGMEKVLGKQGQELGQMSELKQQIEELRSMIGQPQESQEAQPQIQQPPQPTPEQLEQFNEEWMQKWYDNPTRAIADIVYPLAQQIATSQLQEFQPVIEKFKEDQKVSQLAERFEPIVKANPDEFNELLPTMQEIADELGESIEQIPNAERIIYDLAKARYAQINKPKTLEEMLQDPENRAKVLQDEAIRQEILKNHAQQIKQGQPPVVISTQPGIPPATAPNEIKTVKDGTNALKAWLSRIGG